jgi:hypothetical protein
MSFTIQTNIEETLEILFLFSGFLFIFSGVSSTPVS